MSSGEVVLSVRGEAQRTVAPDSASLHGVLRTSAVDKPGALQAAATALGRLTDDLAARGGRPLTPETLRSALTWSVHRAGTSPEQEADPLTGRYVATGRTTATAAVRVVVRDLAVLDEVGDVLAGHEQLHLHDVLWGVDEDNAGWAEARAAAIAAALRRGHDYAAALGGTVQRIEHLADAGLLHGGADHSGGRAFAIAQSADRYGDTPSLTPVPQLLTATVEARLVASGVAVPPG